MRFLTSPSNLGVCVMLVLMFGIGTILIPERSNGKSDETSVMPAEVSAVEAGREDGGQQLEEESTVSEEEPGGDTDGERVPEVDVRELGQLTKGIQGLRHGNWWVCGRHLSEAEEHETAMKIAYSIMVNLASLAPDMSIGMSISPWGIASTMANESGFDPCALGIHPGKWAYDTGLLIRRKLTISHSRQDVLDFISTGVAKEHFSKSGFDLGLCQVLSRFYPGEERDMLTISGGTRICVLEMVDRAVRYSTSRPWLYWRGKETGWYLDKIQKITWRMRKHAKAI